MKSGLFSRGMLYRDGKLFLSSLPRALLLTVIFLVLCAGMAVSVFSSSIGERSPIRLALCDGDNSLYSRAAISFIASQPVISSLISAELTDEDTARSAVSDGSCAGAVILPHGYIDAIMYGTPSSGTVLISDAVLPQYNAVSRLAMLGGRVVLAGQHGVFAGSRVLDSHPEWAGAYSVYEARVNDRLLNEISVSGSTYFTEEETPYSSSSLPVEAHYLLLFITVFLEAVTLFFYRPVTTDLSLRVFSRLCGTGISFAGFLSSKILYAFLFRFSLSSVLFAVIAFYTKLDIGASSFALALLAFMIMSGIGVFLSVSVSGSRYGIALLSLITVFSMFLCGAIIPVRMLAPSLSFIGQLTPLGSAYQLFSPLFGGSCSLLSVFSGILIFLLSGMAAYLRLSRLRQNTGEVS